MTGTLLRLMGNQKKVSSLLRRIRRSGFLLSMLRVGRGSLARIAMSLNALVEESLGYVIEKVIKILSVNFFLSLFSIHICIWQ